MGQKEEEKKGEKKKKDKKRKKKNKQPYIVLLSHSSLFWSCLMMRLRKRPTLRILASISVGLPRRLMPSTSLRTLRIST
jgi:hypothetical protein